MSVKKVLVDSGTYVVSGLAGIALVLTAGGITSLMYDKTEAGKEHLQVAAHISTICHKVRESTLRYNFTYSQVKAIDAYLANQKLQCTQVEKLAQVSHEGLSKFRFSTVQTALDREVEQGTGGPGM